MDQTGFKKSFDALLCFIFFNWKGNQSLVGGLSALLDQQSQAVSLSILIYLNLLFAAESPHIKPNFRCTSAAASHDQLLTKTV